MDNYFLILEFYNLVNELVKEWNWVVVERILMVWICISFFLISFGVGIDCIVVVIYGVFLGGRNGFYLFWILGLFFIIIGILVLLVVVINYCQDLKYIEWGCFIYQFCFFISFVVAIVLVVVGIFVFLVIMF